jgi:glycosyltransferase involved in cell wall biosynthesis
MEKKEGPMESVEVKKISFSILVYNEAASLKSTITSALFTLDKKKLDYEFWVFDNNSNDNTEDIVKSFNHKKITKLL